MISGYNWELYNVKDDPTQSNDLAATMPDKLKEMQALFYSEAKKYNVLPLDNSTLTRWNTPRPSLTAGRKVFTYSGTLTGVPASAAPSILGKSYTITAEVEIPEDGAVGMIATQGGRFGGYGLFLSKGEFGFGDVWTWVAIDAASTRSPTLSSSARPAPSATPGPTVPRRSSRPHPRPSSPAPTVPYSSTATSM